MVESIQVFTINFDTYSNRISMFSLYCMVVCNRDIDFGFNVFLCKDAAKIFFRLHARQLM